MLASSIDGRLTPPGCSAAQFGGRGDRRALEEALAAADGVLVGAETIRRHGTSCLIQQPDLLAGRHDAGLPPQPPVVVASRSGWLPPTLPFFHQPLSRWLLCPTQPTCGPGRGFVRVLRGEADQAGLVSLGAAGLQRLVVLGGARLAASLLAADLIDAIQLTICPRLFGGEGLWLPPGPSLPALTHWQALAPRSLGAGETLLVWQRPNRSAG